VRAGVLAEGGVDAAGQLSLEQVEGLALRTRPWPALVASPASYWVTRRVVGVLLDLPEERVSQLTNSGLLPYAGHYSGQRLYRRAQIEVVANARRAGERLHRQADAPA